MPKNQTVSHETEIALVIRSGRPERIADEIARLNKVGRYRLTPAELHLLHDVYFDTHDGALQARRLALRIRIVNGTPLITLKGSLGRTEQGVANRREIELRWSRAAFARIARELQTHGIALVRATQSYRRDDPVGTLKRAGLHVIQDRITQRRVRNVISTTGRVCAELAMDKTTFLFGKQVVHLHEVEIEAKSARVRVGEMAQQLEKLFAPALQRWHNKLLTGQAIETLLKQGLLPDLLDERNDLTVAAFERIGQEITTIIHAG